MIRFPASPRPLVSVVVVAHGGRPHLERTLESLVEHTPESFEVVLVDSASPDDTGEWASASLEGATVIRSERNLGFGNGCNLGVGSSIGELVLFLNPDVLLAPGWLPPLLEGLDRPGVGAVGPLLLGENHDLQLAGAFVDRSGATHRYGFGDAVIDRPEYQVPRQVDYLAGACLLMRRSDFDDVGGFDAHYGLAYYEDADLCHALASRGLRSVVVPRVRLVHIGDVSGGSRTLAELAIENRRRFADRWAMSIASRPAFPIAGSRRREIAARDAGAPRRVLVLADGRATTDLLFTIDPWVAVTSCCPTSAEDARVEYLGVSDAASELADRFCHYDVVIGTNDHLDEVVARSQPVARRDPSLASRVG